MATLHVRNVPDDLYDSLRDRARKRGHSINAEAIDQLRQLAGDGPRLTVAELLVRSSQLRASQQSAGDGSTVVEIIREDRGR